MDTRTNEFYEAAEPRDPTHLSFAIGEEVEIKGHVFKVAHVRMDPHQLVLTPVRPAQKAAAAESGS